MTKHDLKELAAMGAELGAAKAENERLRGLLQQVVDCQAEHYGDGCGLHLSMITLAGRIKDALSQQAEPVRCPGTEDTASMDSYSAQEQFTAVDMATAAAQGFRDGQAAVEQAPAQDELKPCPFCGETLRVNNANLAVHSRESDCLLRQQPVVMDDPQQVKRWNARPAQTDQQPVACRYRKADGADRAWTYSGSVTAPADGYEVQYLYAAPIAQTAPQSECEWCAGAGKDHFGEKCEHCQAAPQSEQINIDPLLNAGAALSNIAFNLAQRPGVTLDQHVCDLLSSARKRWDAARAALSAQGAGDASA